MRNRWVLAVPALFVALSATTLAVRMRAEPGLGRALSAQEMRTTVGGRLWPASCHINQTCESACLTNTACNGEHYVGPLYVTCYWWFTIFSCDDDQSAPCRFHVHVDANCDEASEKLTDYADPQAACEVGHNIT